MCTAWGIVVRRFLSILLQHGSVYCFVLSAYRLIRAGEWAPCPFAIELIQILLHALQFTQPVLGEVFKLHLDGRASLIGAARVATFMVITAQEVLPRQHPMSISRKCG